MNCIYFFSKDQTDGHAGMRELLGGKGANLAEMAGLGVPVPPGFTITTQVCKHFLDHDGEYPETLGRELDQSLNRLEGTTGKRFGDALNPLLVSVRSGACVSMPGIADTILNLGLTDETVKGLAAKSGNERFAYDSYCRLTQMYGHVVLGIKPRYKLDLDPFEEILDGLKESKGVTLNTELNAADLKELVERFQAAIRDRLSVDFPQDPKEQLWGAIGAVFQSWNNPRAIKYRELNRIHGLIGTAINVQAMVFGNMGERCGTGVAFTRNPSTGENALYGEYLMNAQGEDVVAGIRTPQLIETLEDEMPVAYEELLDIKTKLETKYRDMQDVEFTIENGELYMLQTRSGKRTAAAAVRVAVEMVREGIINKKQAVLRVSPSQIDQLLQPRFDPQDEEKATVLARGVPASPGVASGAAVFSAEAAEAMAETGRRVILVRIELSPEDMGGMNAAQGAVCARGGRQSHAAVIARGMGKCCVAGVGELCIDYEKGQFNVGSLSVQQGDPISLNGSTGTLYLGEIPLREASLHGELTELLAWADELRRLGVRANAYTPHDTMTAVQFGADGIGLCRTEFMFFEGDRIIAVRKILLAADEAGRLKALAKLLPIQQADFEGIFRALGGRPAAIRLLDLALYELLPHDLWELEEMADVMSLSLDEISEKVEVLHEVNPMLGHRGCRLGISYPEISEMQVRAIMEAACNVFAEGVPVHPEIMIPFVGNVKELALQRELSERVAKAVLREKGLSKPDIPYLIGTTIEVPRAAVTADEVASEAEFFTFGTEHLTQTVCGFSRDDAGRFLVKYIEQGIYQSDPFRVLDQPGVGKLMSMACKLGRQTRTDLKLGVYGEHCSDPSSISFCHAIGVDYISCSPYIVPIARLVAAQAALEPLH